MTNGLAKTKTKKIKNKNRTGVRKERRK